MQIIKSAELEEVPVGMIEGLLGAFSSKDGVQAALEAFYEATPDILSIGNPVLIGNVVAKTAGEMDMPDEVDKLLKDIEYPLVHVLSRVEQNGAKIDKKKLGNHSKELGEKISDLSKQAFEIAGEEFNLDSPKQLLEILYEKQGLPVLRKTPKGQPSTNEETLQRLSEEYELPKIILQYRTLAKLKSTYTDSLINIENPKTKRIHTSYQQAITSTGRLSSTEPNLQNIPIKTAEGRRIREAFVPEKGNILISADYSQIELRIMAHLSEDKNLTNAFNNNIDVHSSTAAEVFGVAIEDVTKDQTYFLWGLSQDCLKKTICTIF